MRVSVLVSVSVSVCVFVCVDMACTCMCEPMMINRRCGCRRACATHLRFHP